MLGVFRRLGLGALAAAALFSLGSAAPANVAIRSLEERASSADRLVFCHFMVSVYLGSIRFRTNVVLS